MKFKTLLIITLFIFVSCDNQKTKVGFVEIESEKKSVKLDKSLYEIVDLPPNVIHNIEKKHTNDELIRLVSFHPAKQERILGEDKYGKNNIDTSIVVVKVYLLENDDTSIVNYVINENMEIVYEF